LARTDPPNEPISDPNGLTPNQSALGTWAAKTRSTERTTNYQLSTCRGPLAGRLYAPSRPPTEAYLGAS